MQSYVLLLLVLLEQNAYRTGEERTELKMRRDAAVLPERWAGRRADD